MLVTYALAHGSCHCFYPCFKLNNIVTFVNYAGMSFNKWLEPCSYFIPQGSGI